MPEPFVSVGWEHCIVEWLWAEGSIRLNMPGNLETFQEGSYQEVVELLTLLGQQGWEVATCAGIGNWLLWTLKRQKILTTQSAQQAQ